MSGIGRILRGDRALVDRAALRSLVHTVAQHAPDGHDDPNFTSPEPVDDPLGAGLFDQTDAIASECRVVLNGGGIYNLMYFQMWPYVRSRIRRREWRSALRDVARYWRMRPSIWPGIRRRVRNLFQEDPAAPALWAILSGRSSLEDADPKLTEIRGAATPARCNISSE